MIKKSIMLFFCKYRKLKTLKYIFLRKVLAISIICDNVAVRMKECFTKKNQLKLLGLIDNTGECQKNK